MGKPSRSVPHFDVQALPDENAWNLLLRRFPRILGQLTLTSVWDTLRFKPLYYAEAVTQPLRIVHGDADESVPLEQGRQFYERAKGPERAVRAAGRPALLLGNAFGSRGPAAQHRVAAKMVDVKLMS